MICYGLVIAYTIMNPLSAKLLTTVMNNQDFMTMEGS